MSRIEFSRSEAAQSALWIDDVADRFEALWLTGTPPSIAELAAGTTGDRRRALLEELINIDRSYREKLGQCTSREDYLAEFPELSLPSAAAGEMDAGLSASFRGADGDASAVAPGALRGVATPAFVAGYEILGELGRGSMGVVYVARQGRLKRTVALKMILAGSLAGPEQLARFRLEVEAVARLQHPHIVQIHEVGEHNGLPFCLLEYVEGGSLAQKLNGAPQPPRQAAELVSKLALAVHAAHQHGIIHRDLKPSNILLTAEGLPKIADFGLAKHLDNDAGYTQTGVAVGTPSYMAVEQAEGRTHDIGPATDVYALGAILYEMLTGRPPFRGATSLETLEQVRTCDPVPPSQLQPGLPRDLETICLKCLEREVGRRYQTAQLLADELTRWLDGRPILARPAGRVERTWRWCRSNAIVAASSAAVVLTLVSGGIVSGYFAIQAQLRSVEATSARTAEATHRYYELLNRAREASSMRRPGWTWQGLDELTEASKIPTSSRNLVNLRSEVATCLAGVDLRQVGALTDVTEPFCLAFTSDGRRMAVAPNLAYKTAVVVVYDVQSRQPLETYSFPASVTSLLTTGKPDGIFSLAFSPDGRWLVVGSRFGTIHAWDTAAHPAQHFTQQAHKTQVVSLLASRDGSRLYSASDDGEVKSWRIPPEGSFLSSWKTDGLTNLSLSPDGRTIACGVTPPTMLDGETLQPIENWPIRGWAKGRVCFSPNGLLLASDFQAGGELCLVSAQTGQIARRFADPEAGLDAIGDVSSIDFSPDGTLLVTSVWNRGLKLWDVASGTLVCKLPLNHRVYPVFQPQGRLLAATGNGQVLLFELAGMREQTVTAQQLHPIRAIDVADQSHGLACAALQIENEGTFVRSFVTRWDLASGRLLSEWQLDNEIIRPTSTIALDPKGEFVALSLRAGGQGREGAIVLWRADGNDQARRLEVPDPKAVIFSRDRKKLWGAMRGQRGSPPSSMYERIVSWTVPDLELMSDWSNSASEIGNASEVNSLSASDQWVVAGSSDGTMKLLHAEDGRFVAAFANSVGRLRCVAMSPRDELAVGGTEQGALVLVRVAEKQVSTIPNVHTDYVTSLAFSGDGRLLASASEDRTIRFWQVQPHALTPLFTLRSAGGPVTSLRMNHDGSTLFYLVVNETAVRVCHLDLLRQRLAEMGLDWQ